MAEKKEEKQDRTLFIKSLREKGYTDGQIMAEYYNSDYVKFYDKTREIRQELFNSLKLSK